MATEVDIKVARKLPRVMERVGTLATFVVSSGKVYDVESGTTYDTGVQEYTRLITPPNAEVIKIAGNTIERPGNMMCITLAYDLEFELRPDDQMIHDGVNWTIMEVEAIRSGDDTAAYILKLQN